MRYPITRSQLVAAVQNLGLNASDSEVVVRDLESTGRIELGGSMVTIVNPTDPDAVLLSGLCTAARGGSAGSVGNYRIAEYFRAQAKRFNQRGSSRRV